MWVAPPTGWGAYVEQEQEEVSSLLIGCNGETISSLHLLPFFVSLQTMKWKDRENQTTGEFAIRLSPRTEATPNKVSMYLYCDVPSHYKLRDMKLGAVNLYLPFLNCVSRVFITVTKYQNETVYITSLLHIYSNYLLYLEGNALLCRVSAFKTWPFHTPDLCWTIIFLAF